jgi:hypothetical protein
MTLNITRISEPIVYKFEIYVSCHLRLSQRHTTQIIPISSTDTAASQIVEVLASILPEYTNKSS